MKKIRFVIPLATGVVIFSLLAISIFNFVYRTNFEIGAMIADDVKKLVIIFDQINKTCGILSFDQQKNNINFLNVASFVGSEVGSMNLAYPDKWAGPYILDNPEIQGKEYMVVNTKKGYFITPGDGVKLPSGAIIGKDIILDQNADIEAMISDRKQFYFKGRPLAAKVALYATQENRLADVWSMNG